MADDLFRWIDALYTKEPMDGTPPTFMMHRFLASDRDYAEACHVLQKEVREPELVFHVWKGLLPKMTAAPRFSYVAPKKGPAEEVLVSKMMRETGERRAVCEEMLDTLRRIDTSKVDALYLYYGVEPITGATEPEAPSRPATGLLA